MAIHEPSPVERVDTLQGLLALLTQPDEYQKKVKEFLSLKADIDKKIGLLGNLENRAKELGRKEQDYQARVKKLEADQARVLEQSKALDLKVNKMIEAMR